MLLLLVLYCTFSEDSTCPGGFERISTVTIMYLVYSVNVYIFNVVIKIKLYSIKLDS